MIFRTNYDPQVNFFLENHEILRKKNYTKTFLREMSDILKGNVSVFYFAKQEIENIKIWSHANTLEHSKKLFPRQTDPDPPRPKKSYFGLKKQIVF